MTRTSRYILWGLLAALVIIQLFQIDKTNPPIDSKQDYIVLAAPSEQIVSILKDACYDCHSHETKYPWYTNVQPVAWWIKGHINHGRKHLNFSEWGTYSGKKKAHKMEECYEMVEEKEMPLNSYTWVHPEARLDAAQRQTLVAWFKAEEDRYK